MSIADQIIETGPVPAGETFTVHCTPAEINELRNELIAARAGTTYEEWRVTGADNDLAPVDLTWHYHQSDAEQRARTYLERARTYGWTDGPHLHKRTVTVTDWTEVDT
jgi:hypothetical protein